ncbi:hypothetical protein M422DRAFT_774702 [Sphaerobolus stellatus SS14]|nr:hypothetical protein M422DRAFT_774702 [Sphaerobolus stellatus SS14]
MGLLNLTIQGQNPRTRLKVPVLRLSSLWIDPSPFITYSAGWIEGTDSNSVDPFHADYNGTFRVTQNANSQASISFFGTAVTIFGAIRDNHGNYSVVLDGGPAKFIASGFHSPNLFNVSLWNAEGLTYQKHTVILTNIPTASGPFLDIDYIDIERQIGNPADPIFQTFIDDTSTNQVNYSAGSWTLEPIGTAFENTLHRTASAGAQVIITFKGCCIEVYGQYANANFTVLVDDQVPVKLTGLDIDLDDQHQHPQTLLYLVDGLAEETMHTVTLTNLDSDEQRPLFFDYAVVSSIHNFTDISANPGNNGTASPTQPNGTPVSSSNTNHAKSTMTPTGAIVGIVLGVLAILSIILAILYFYRRRHKQKSNKPNEQRLSTETTTMTTRSSARIEPFVLPPADTRPSEKSRMQTANRTTTSQYTHSRYPSSTEPESMVSGFSNQTSSSRDRSHNTDQPSQNHSFSGVSSADLRSAPSSSSVELSSSVSAPGRHSRESRPLPSLPIGSPQTENEAAFNDGPVSSSKSRPPPIQEEDAGIVVARGGVSAGVTLPPAYNPEWDSRIV